MARSGSSSGAKRTPASPRRSSSGERVQTCPKNDVVAPKPTGGPSPLVTGWLVLAGWVGSLFRLLGAEDLPKEDRRDGVPFALVLFAVVGIIIAWFNVNQVWAQTLDTYTVAGFFGRLAFALPVILLVFAGWLFRHPSSVYNNGRVGVGLALMLTSISGMSHLALGRPAPGDARLCGACLRRWAPRLGCGRTLCVPRGLHGVFSRGRSWCSS